MHMVFDDWAFLLPLWSRRALAEWLGRYSSQTSTLQTSYSCWWEAFFLRCLGSFLYSAVCREVSLSSVLLLFSSFSTDSPHFILNPNIKYPDSHVNIQYSLIVKGQSQSIIFNVSGKKKAQGILCWLSLNQWLFLKNQLCTSNFFLTLQSLKF